MERFEGPVEGVQSFQATSVETAIEEGSVPLCVDLDGTLVRTDTLVQSSLQLLRTDPLEWLRFPAWLFLGKAVFKERVAARVRLDPASLPYNRELLEYLRRERAAGRRLILVTASDAKTAQSVADHVSLFDEVMASDGRTNLKSHRKREALVRRFGKGGFDYAGDSAADLAVWPAAREAIVVNASKRVLKHVGSRPKTILDRRRGPGATELLRAIRIHQWVKNLLIFAPTLLAHRYADPGPMVASVIGFLAFGLGASAVYVLNDLLDIEADRHHPKKRKRPFASGELPLQLGFLMILVLLTLSLALAVLLPLNFLGLLLAYFVVTTLYSVSLKEVAVVDILVLAALYTLRIITGSAASGVTVSEWLLAFSMFLFLSLAAVKRYAELLRVRETSIDVGAGTKTRVERRGYFAGDLELIVQMGLASGYIAVLVLALYITSDTVTRFYQHPKALWFACALLLYWISRTWLLAHRGIIYDDPLSFSVRDRGTWWVAGLGVAVVLAARGW